MRYVNHCIVFILHLELRVCVYAHACVSVSMDYAFWVIKVTSAYPHNHTQSLGACQNQRIPARSETPLNGAMNAENSIWNARTKARGHLRGLSSDESMGSNPFARWENPPNEPVFQVARETVTLGKGVSQTGPLRGRTRHLCGTGKTHLANAKKCLALLALPRKLSSLMGVFTLEITEIQFHYFL